MLTDLEAPPDSIQFWSWKKILPWFLGILTVFIAAILLYDEKLEPFEELKQHLRPMPRQAGNGYFILRDSWQSLPQPDKKIRQRWNSMQQGKDPWDNTVAYALNPGGHDLTADLVHALAAPDWMIPVRAVDYEQGPFPIYARIEALRAAALQRLLAGHAEPAMTLIPHLRHLSRRQIEGSNDSMEFQKGCYGDLHAATLTAQLLMLAPLDDAMLEKLAGYWAEDQLSQSDLMTPAAGDSEHFAAFLDDGAGLLYFSTRDTVLFRVMMKKHRTLNRMNQMLLLIGTRALATATERNLTMYAEADRLKQQMAAPWGWLDSNCGGKKIVSACFTAFNYGKSVFITLPRQKLFGSRATRVAVALKRWQVVHDGLWPADLDELVPALLPEIPQDPWNGKPLQWDPAGEFIFAVGENWKAEKPSPGEFDFSGLGMSNWLSPRLSLKKAMTVLPSKPATKKP